MRTRLMIATATTAVLLAGAAFAQPTGASGSNFSSQQPAAEPSINPTFPHNAARAAGAIGSGNDPLPATAPAPAVSTDVTAPAAPAAGLSTSDAATVAPAAGAPAERAPTATAGTDLVASSPVPDTAENRAKYGQPLSRTGRMTKPAGN